jgi:tetratricopeptide (TPR) repeat protein
VNTVTDVAAALDDNADSPAGPARTARAERLVELAAGTGDRPLLIRALQDQIQAYEYDAGGARILVPFARVLRLWDDDPADFDRGARYRLFWHFKWVTGGMIWHPTVALPTIENWLDEMATRYRQANYGEHAVLAQRHRLADHVGDLDTAEEIFGRWTTTARDTMSDCHACDRGSQGSWHSTRGRYAQALDLWQPVLAGELTCAEEPHRLLATSLLPLVRLGRVDEARANHLRGYRMARGNANMRPTIARHIEFAAVTGNEARGLEILADHAAWLTDSDEAVMDRMSFLEGAAVLLRRLCDLGHGDLAVSTPRGEEPSVAVARLLPELEAEIAGIVARFDERNGTTAVSRRSRTRIEQPPLLESLPLGVRAAALGLAATSAPGAGAAPRPSPPAAGPAAGDGPADLAGLVATATDLDGRRHPRAEAAWERVAAAGDLAPALSALVGESRARATARTEPGRAVDLFTDVAARFADLGDRGGQARNRARAGLAAVLGGAPEGVDTVLGALADLLAAPTGTARRRDLDVVRACCAKAMLARWLRGPQEPAPDDLVATVDDEVARTAAESFERADALMLRAQIALRTGAPDQARESVAAAVAALEAVRAPWACVDPLTLLARLELGRGDAAAAERLLVRAQSHGGDLLEPGQLGTLLRLRAAACAEQEGRGAEVVSLALAAAHQFDPVDEVAAADARLAAASAFQHDDRPDEAAALFEAVLPDLRRHGDEANLVRALHDYAQVLRRLDEDREAAAALLEAASVARNWPNQTAHASLAHEAGTALDAAGRPGDAARAYERAETLWAELGEVPSQIRAVRARAWLRAGADDWAGAVELLGQAAGLSPDGSVDEVRHEGYGTGLQTAQALLGWLAERDDAPPSAAADALAAADGAARGFDDMGDLASAARAAMVAANAEAQYLDRSPAAATRLRGMAARCRDADRTDLAEWCESVADDLT